MAENQSTGAARPSTGRPVLRFVLGFVLLLAPFTVFFYGYLVETRLFETYLQWNASISGALLSLFGETVTVDGVALHSAAASLEIRHGCDAILPVAILAAGILASPVARRAKLAGIAVGGAALLGLNIVRIVTLYYARVYRPAWFHALHVEIWQPAFIFLALAFWILWALRATRVATAPAPEGP